MAKYNANEFNSHRINVRYSAGKNNRINSNVKNMLKELRNSSIEYAKTHDVNDSAYLFDNAK